MCKIAIVAKKSCTFTFFTTSVDLTNRNLLKIKNYYAFFILIDTFSVCISSWTFNKCINLREKKITITSSKN